MAAALGAMFFDVEHRLFSNDDSANLHFVEIRDHTRRRVSRRVRRVPLRRAGAVEVLLKEALDFGVAPDGLEPIEPVGLKLLPLKPRVGAEQHAL